MKKIIICLAIVLGISSVLFGIEQGKPRDPKLYFAQITFLIGDVKVKRVNSYEWISASKDMKLSEGDTIKTGFGANAELKIVSSGIESTMKVRERAEVKIHTLHYDKRSGKPKSVLDLATGEVLIKARSAGPSLFEVKTPTSIVGVRGTVFSVNVVEIK